MEEGWEGGYNYRGNLNMDGILNNIMSIFHFLGIILCCGYVEGYL